MKVRRIDFYPDDWLAGTGMLTIDERGVYVTAVAAIGSEGGPITPDHLRKLCPGHKRVFNRVLDQLLMLGKLYETEDGKLGQKRCETELKQARNRIETSRENGQKGGRPSSKNKEITKPAGSARGRASSTTTITTTNEEKGSLSRATKERRSGVRPDWHPDAKGIAFARERAGWGMPRISEEAERFRDFHRGKGNLFADIDAAWRTWVMNSEKFERGSRGRSIRQSPITALYEGAWRAAEQSEREQADRRERCEVVVPLLDRGRSG
jgi:uncharacterized protein YdaU (DUF1376 family)